MLLIDHQTGRAHALCDYFLRTDADVVVHYGPGHPTIRNARLVPVPQISLRDVRTVVEYCRTTKIDMVLVSWIDSLALGYVDALQAAGIQVVGPSRAGAELESSKRRGKEFCAKFDIPVAPYECFDDPLAALEHVRSRPYPVVVKENGLTDVSDGVRMCATALEAEEAVLATVNRMGEDFSVVIERRLKGQDVSLLALTDGTDYLLLPSALDYKRSHDHDLGINCDGMGTIAPHPNLDDDLIAQARQIFDRIMTGFAAEGIHYTGFLYVGGMITGEGLSVLEINSRLGDSEAQAVLPMLLNNFTDVCESVVAGRLNQVQLELDPLMRCCIAATQGRVAPDDPTALPGWPFGAYASGQLIHGIDDVDPEKATVFLAGTGLDEHGRYVTTRGRVLYVVGHGESLAAATASAYEEIARISFAGLRYRTDIGSTKVRAQG